MASLSKKIIKILDRIGSLSPLIQLLFTGVVFPMVLYLLGKLTKLDSKTLAIVVLIMSAIAVISLSVNYVLFKRRTAHSKSDKADNAENVANLEGFGNTPTRSSPSGNIGVAATETVGIRLSGGVSNFKKTKIRDKHVGVDQQGGDSNFDDLDIR
jgi:hypothetical protein